MNIIAAPRSCRSSFWLSARMLMLMLGVFAGERSDGFFKALAILR